MPVPENPRSTATIIAELTDVQRRLERADENENQIERTSQRNKLLELQDELEAEISSTNLSRVNPQ